MFKEKKWSNRIQLILLFIIFLAPLVGAYYAFYTRDHSVHDTVNKGEFYSTPQDLADTGFVMTNNNGESQIKQFNDFDNRWYLMVVANNECNKICESNLEKIAYVRVVHARYTGRIVSTFAHFGLSAERSQQLIDNFGLMGISPQTAEGFQEWLKPFYEARDQSQFDSDRIYMIDPLKKLMMSYPSDVSPLDIYEDMKRLLKTSRVG